ncbi:MAG: cupredoxin domain-containing protein [Acidimicrobiales bacterium]
MSQASPPPQGRRANYGAAPIVAVVAVILVTILLGLGVSVAAVAGVADGVRTVAGRLTSVAAIPVKRHATVTESMEILTSSPFGPRYTHSSWTVRAGDTVIVRIKSYDDGTAPLTGMQAMMFATVHGTLGGSESVAGKPVSYVANGDIAHTFTVVGLGLNLPIPAAPTGRSVTVVARFVARRTGTFVWQCYAPCGSGPNLMGGPMSTNGWMEGTVRVIP